MTVPNAFGSPNTSRSCGRSAARPPRSRNPSVSCQSPIIATFLSPTHADWDFRTFYDALVARGFAIYPGKLTEAETFRIGCIGDVDGDDMASVVTHIEEITVASTTAEPANH